jgi:hypothetical protein
MKKSDMRRLIDENKLEFEVRSSELLRVKNEVELKIADQRKLEDWLNILRGKYDSLMKIYEQTLEDID